jgi:hypothetical protein
VYTRAVAWRGKADAVVIQERKKIFFVPMGEDEFTRREEGWHPPHHLHQYP